MDFFNTKINLNIFYFQTLENSTDSHIAIHVNALLEIVKIVTLAKSRNC